jgi:hypothetical protein
MPCKTGKAHFAIRNTMSLRPSFYLVFFPLKGDGSVADARPLYEQAKGSSQHVEI